MTDRDKRERLAGEIAQARQNLPAQSNMSQGEKNLKDQVDAIIEYLNLDIAEVKQ